MNKVREVDFNDVDREFIKSVFRAKRFPKYELIGDTKKRPHQWSRGRLRQRGTA